MSIARIRGGESNAICILGSAWCFTHSTDTNEDTTAVQFSVTVPSGQPTGTYTAQPTIKVEQRPPREASNPSPPRRPSGRMAPTPSWLARIIPVQVRDTWGYEAIQGSALPPEGEQRTP